jgi:serine/threonine-protein kinase Chk2
MEATQEVHTEPASGKPTGWAELVSLDQGSFPSQALVEKIVTFGRKSDCTVRFTEQAISTLHARLYVDEEASGKSKETVVFLEDLSSNGTFVNKSKIGKGKRVRLNNGDEITFHTASQKDGGAKVGFVFRLAAGPKSAEDATGPERDYDIRETLGEGNFAVVKLCVHKQTGEKFAIKCIDKKKIDNKDSLMTEVRILCNIKHPHVVSIKDTYETPQQLYLVLEMAPGGDLFDRVVSKKTYPENEARALMRNLCAAIQYLHSQGIAHRDLKPENILMASKDDDVDIKVSDFGLSKVVGEDQLMKTLCGTPQYLAPEVFEKREGNSAGYSKAVDVWSMGVILYILLCGYPPFDANDFDKIRNAQYNFNHKMWNKVSAEAKDLVTRMLTADPAARISVPDILQHPWTVGADQPAAATKEAPKRKRNLEVPQRAASKPRSK